MRPPRDGQNQRTPRDRQKTNQDDCCTSTTTTTRTTTTRRPPRDHQETTRRPKRETTNKPPGDCQDNTRTPRPNCFPSCSGRFRDMSNMLPPVNLWDAEPRPKCFSPCTGRMQALPGQNETDVLESQSRFPGDAGSSGNVERLGHLQTM